VRAARTLVQTSADMRSGQQIAHGDQRGRSRHGAPVRKIQSTASTNRRLSSPARPLSPSLPGTNFLDTHPLPVGEFASNQDRLLQFAILNHIRESVGIL
jgi:hypothetical protein